MREDRNESDDKYNLDERSYGEIGVACIHVLLAPIKVACFHSLVSLAWHLRPLSGLYYGSLIRTFHDACYQLKVSSSSVQPFSLSASEM